VLVCMWGLSACSPFILSGDPANTDHGAFSIIWCILKESPNSQPSGFQTSLTVTMGDIIHIYHNESIVPSSRADTYKQVPESHPSFPCSAHLWCLFASWKPCRSQNFKQWHYLSSKSPKTELSLTYLSLKILTTVVILGFHPLDSSVCLVLGMEQKPNTKIFLQALLASPW